jgi:hypothetical protein
VGFQYFVIHRNRRRDAPRGLFAFRADEGRLHTVSWNHVERRWVFNPEVARYVVGEDSGDAEEATRGRAEQVAVHLGFGPLPSEEELACVGSGSGARGEGAGG